MDIPQLQIIQSSQILFCDVIKSEDLATLQTIVIQARREHKKVIVPITTMVLDWIAKNPRDPSFQQILFTNSSTGDYPITSLQQMLRDFQKIASHKFGGSLILNMASMLKYASRYETNDQIRQMKHIISQISKRCFYLNLYDRDINGAIVPPFKGYLFKIMPEKTASILYLHCLNEFKNIVLRFPYNASYVEFLNNYKRKQLTINNTRTYTISRRLAAYFFKQQTRIQETIKSDSEIVVETKHLYSKVSDHIQTLIELQQLDLDPIEIKTTSFDKYNISRDIFSLIALAYDPVFADGYIFADAMDMSNFEDELLYCVCGRVFPFAQFVFLMRSEELQQQCQYIQMPGVDRNQCTHIIKTVQKQLIPFPSEVCGSYERGAVQGIKNVYIIVNRNHFEAVKQRIQQIGQSLNLASVQETASSHKFLLNGLKVSIVYVQSESERILKTFRYNCSVPFLWNFTNVLAVYGAQLTDDGLLFDMGTNKQVEIKKEDDIFTMANLKPIPVKFRVGGFISQIWQQAHILNEDVFD